MPFCQHCGGEVQLGWKACPQCANPIVNIPQPTIPQIPPTGSNPDILDSIDELLGSTPSIQDSVVMGNVGDTTNYHQSTSVDSVVIGDVGGTTNYHSSTSVNRCGGCGASGDITVFQCKDCRNSFCSHCNNQAVRHGIVSFCFDCLSASGQRNDGRMGEMRQSLMLKAGAERKWYLYGVAFGTVAYILGLLSGSDALATPPFFGCCGWTLLGAFIGNYRSWWGIKEETERAFEERLKAELEAVLRE